MAEKISVIGAGSWGSALAKVLADKGNNILIWAYEKEVANSINTFNRNHIYLPEIEFPKCLRATTDLSLAIKGHDVVVSALPSHALRNIWKMAAPYLEKDAILVSCTKGIEGESLKLMNEVLDEVVPLHESKNTVVLSGPSFAKEVALSLPTSVVVAGKDASVCKKVQDLFRTDSFLIFTSDDVVGVEIGGAVKNVIAIATGISDGLNFGHNSRAAIITRGLYEMIKIGKALGANLLTFAGLSGIGDLVLTCTADMSRNHTVGRKIGEGQKISKILAGMKVVAEGVPTSKAVFELTKKHNINAPICDAMYRIIYEGLSPRDAVTKLCNLPLGEELSAIMRKDI